MKRAYKDDSEQHAKVGDLVKPAGYRAQGKYSKGGIICRVAEVDRQQRRRWGGDELYTSYRYVSIHTIWGP